jgi:hypothetical protein
LSLKVLPTPLHLGGLTTYSGIIKQEDLMAFPGTYNFNYYRGDTFKFTITPYDSSGSSFSLTGYAAIFTIADKRGTGAVQYGPTAGTTAVINTSTNLITCTLPAAVGRNLVGGSTYVYDVQISDGTNIYTLLTGTITSTDDITGAV